jgi:hypothetical protein
MHDESRTRTGGLPVIGHQGGPVAPMPSAHVPTALAGLSWVLLCIFDMASLSLDRLAVLCPPSTLCLRTIARPSRPRAAMAHVCAGHLYMRFIKAHVDRMMMAELMRYGELASLRNCSAGPHLEASCLVRLSSRRRCRLPSAHLRRRMIKRARRYDRIFCRCRRAGSRLKQWCPPRW